MHGHVVHLRVREFEVLVLRDLNQGIPVLHLEMSARCHVFDLEPFNGLEAGFS